MDENAFCRENGKCHFQRAMESMLTDEISNMIIYQDDICLGTTTIDELKQKTEHVK